jgi:DNA (cytosine-5)-methyltransferase 1
MGIPSPPAILMPDLSVVTPDVRDAERLQGFPAGWTDLEGQPTGTGRPFNQRRRWLLVGNAVNVEVSTWIGEQLAESKSFDGDLGTPLETGGLWPTAAWWDGKKRYAVAKATWPVSRPHKSLANFLQNPGSPLSIRATAGFYNRICASKLRFKAGFKAAIAAHLEKVEAAQGKIDSRRERSYVTAGAS